MERIFIIFCFIIFLSGCYWADYQRSMDNYYFQHLGSIKNEIRQEAKILLGRNSFLINEKYGNPLSIDKNMLTRSDFDRSVILVCDEEWSYKIKRKTGGFQAESFGLSFCIVDEVVVGINVL